MIENIQPTWVTRQNEKRRYILLVHFTIAILVGTIGGFSSLPIIMYMLSKYNDLSFSIVFILGNFFFYGFMSFLFSLTSISKDIMNKIKPVDAIHFSWLPALRGLAFVMVFMPICWFTNHLIYSAIGLLDVLPAWIFYGIVALLLAGSKTLTSSNTVSQSIKPNQGLKNSLTNGFWVGLPVFLIGGFLFGLNAVRQQPSSNNILPDILMGLSGGISYGAIMGLLAFLYFGGFSVIQYFVLTIVLFRNGNIPRTLIDFLDFSTQINILRKVGGGYMFIYPPLLEYFASDLDKLE